MLCLSSGCHYRSFHSPVNRCAFSMEMPFSAPALNLTTPCAGGCSGCVIAMSQIGVKYFVSADSYRGQKVGKFFSYFVSLNHLLNFYPFTGLTSSWCFRHILDTPHVCCIGQEP